MKKYFLFGEVACRMVANRQDDETAATTAAFIRNDIYELFVWDEDSSPEHLLACADGYFDWCVIDEDLYNELSKD